MKNMVSRYGALDLSRAAQAQIIISRKVSIERLGREPRRVIGLDVSYRGDYGYAAAVSIDYATHEIEEIGVAEGITVFPYIPGFLAFREAPLMIKAFLSLKTREGILMVNGHGLAHPRKCGIASYLGVVLNMPSIGIARSLLYGEVRRDGGREYIVVDGRYVGIVIGSGRHAIYITIGNKVDIDDLEAIVLKMMPRKGELPLPIYWADRISRQISRGESSLDSFLKQGRRSIEPGQ